MSEVLYCIVDVYAKQTHQIQIHEHYRTTFPTQKLKKKTGTDKDYVPPNQNNQEFMLASTPKSAFQLESTKSLFLFPKRIITRNNKNDLQ